MEGLTYREGEIRVHGLMDQFVMKGQALAGLAQYPGRKASWRLLTSAELGLSRTVERSASENDGPRIEATQHLDRFHREGLQLTEDEQPE